MENSAQVRAAADRMQDNALNYAVMAAFMESGRVLDRASSLFLIVAALACLPGAPAEWLAAVCLVLNLGLALAEKYYGWRVALDAELFKILSRHAGQEAVFDEALAGCLARQANGVRSAASRWQGAKRLLRAQGALLALQGIATIFAGISRLALV